ncbi:hypothetical protein [Methylobacterium sp. Leaf118]|uniref:hypothetical protein n=1 Tax=Methylobacterium sp. Leaf118 TaxID=2876562 RepID=UPI001E59290A|nr:hypothetical protein [Methylobacterium sp. Leaf118]
MPKAKPPTVTDPAAELSGLTASQASLRDRQASLAAETEIAVARRRELLISGTDPAALADAERTCRDLEGTTLAITDALAEIERRITDCRARIAVANEKAEREATAAGLERDAGAIVAATKPVAEAVAALVKAHKGLASAISGRAAAIHDPRLDSAPSAIASSFMLGELLTALPSLDLVDGSSPIFPGHPPERIQAGHAAARAETLALQLREKAAAVQVGEASVKLPAFETVVPIVQAPRDEVWVYVSTPCFYRLGETKVMVTPSYLSLPVPVALRAIEFECASREPDDAWRRSQRDAGWASITSHSYSWDECVDLDLDLDAHRAAESARLTAEARTAAAA